MMENLRLSLTDLLGADYTRAVCEARALLTGESPEALRALADERIDWYPEAFARRQEVLMEKVGCRVADGLASGEAGAPTDSYRAAQHGEAAPRCRRWGPSAWARTAACIYRQERALSDSAGADFPAAR